MKPSVALARVLAFLPAWTVAAAWAAEPEAPPAGAPVALPAVSVPLDEPPAVPTTLEEMGAAHEALRKRLVDLFNKAKDRLDGNDAELNRVHGELAKLNTIANDLRTRNDLLEKMVPVLENRIPEVERVYGVATAAIAIVAVLSALFLFMGFVNAREVRRDIDAALSASTQRAVDRVDDTLHALKARTDEALDRSLKSIESASEAEATTIGLRAAHAELDKLRAELSPLGEAVGRLRRDLDHYARLEQADKNPRVLLVAAETARTHGEAILYLEQLLDIDASADVLFSAAALAHQQYKSVPLAISLYEKGLDKAKDRVGVRAVYLSLLAYMPGQREKARSELMALAQKYRDDTIVASLFNFFIRAGDDTGHRDAARALLQDGKGSAIVHRNLALALGKTGGDAKEIHEHFRKALALDDTGESLEGYVEWLLASEQAADAETVVRQALGRSPLDFNSRVLLARVLAASGRLDAAKAEYQRILDRAHDADPLSARAARLGLEEVAMREIDRKK